MHRYLKFKILVNFLFLCCFANPALALEENTGVWFDVSQYQHIGKSKKFSLAWESQIRFLDHKNAYQLNLTEIGIGYRFRPTMIFMSGYQWFSSSPLEESNAQNRVYEELYWWIVQNKYFTLRTRSRFEQNKAEHESAWENRVREKITLFFLDFMPNRIVPVIYDEMFIKLNNPSWDNTYSFQENRFFIGADIIANKKIFFEVGYLQQYIFDKQETRLDNIIYLGINFNLSMLPVYDYMK